MTEAPDFLKNLITGLKEELGTEMQKSIAGHYGVSEETYIGMVRAMVCDMVMNPSKLEAIDAIFEDLAHKERLRILAYVHARKVADGISL